MSVSVKDRVVTFIDDPAATVEKNVRLSDGDETVTQYFNGWKLLLAATSEDETATVDFGDRLIFDIDKLKRVTFRAAVSAIPAGVSAYIGLASAHNATVDSIASRILFQMEGSSNVTVRTDDGVTDSGDIATPFSVDGTVQDFTIDLKSGVESSIPAYLSKTGKSAVQFFSESKGSGLRKLQKSGMTMAAYASGLQPYVRILKPSGTAVGSIVLYSICYELEE